MAEATFFIAQEPTKFHGCTRGLEVVIDPDRDTATRSIDFLLMALGSCTIATITNYLRRKNLPIENMRVVLSSEVDTASNRYSDINVDIMLDDEIAEEQAKIIASIAKTCRIHKTLEDAVNVKIEVNNNARQIGGIPADLAR